jgi:hypothetical protein
VTSTVTAGPTLTGARRGGGLAIAAKAGSADLLSSVRDAFMTSLKTTMWVSGGIALPVPCSRQF